MAFEFLSSAIDGKCPANTHTGLITLFLSSEPLLFELRFDAVVQQESVYQRVKRFFRHPAFETDLVAVRVRQVGWIGAAGGCCAWIEPSGR